MLIMGASLGITYYNNKFYIVDRDDDKVYVYNTDGSRASGNDFDFLLLATRDQL